MTARTYPVDAVSGAPSYTGRALRQTLSVLVPGATSARPLGAQSGVRPGTPPTTVSVASSTYTVTPHAGVLDVETAAAAGPYLYAFDANVTGSVNAAHATYTRWDGIYVQLSDSNESDGTSGTPGVAIVYVAGTASASPAMPTQPARSLLLAKIVVPNSGGGASSVVWLAPTIISGPASFASLADLQLRNSTAPVAAHSVVGEGSTMAEYVHDGTSWTWMWSPAAVPVEAGISGTQILTTSQADLAGMTVTVNNPSTDSVWEIRVDLDTQITANTTGTLQVQLVANGVAQSGTIIFQPIANLMNFRPPVSRTWRISGIAAGTSRVIKLQAASLSAANWQVLAGSHMLVRQVG